MANHNRMENFEKHPSSNVVNSKKSGKGSKVFTEKDVGKKVKIVAAKYLKKIKTLQQNKRRQDVRIERLSNEHHSLNEKIRLQAGYLDVLCGLLGEDYKKKFKGRLAMGILGGDTGPEGTDDDKAELSMSTSDSVKKKKNVKENCSETTPPSVHHVKPHVCRRSILSSEAQLEQDHQDGPALDLVDDKLLNNPLYCIEEITDEDFSSLFLY